MSKSELENFLERSVKTEVVEEEAAPEVAAETEAAPEADKGGKDAETPAAEKGSTANSGESWTKSAYLDEKRKRQELEEKLAALEKPRAKDDVDLFADPEGFKQSLREEMKQEAYSIRSGISREILMENKTDYLEKEAKFLEMAKADPSLAQKVMAHANPAKFAYETAAKQMQLDEIGDPVAYREKLKAEILAELKGSEEKPDKPAKQTTERPPSLATASAAGSNTVQPKKTLEELFER